MIETEEVPVVAGAVILYNSDSQVIINIQTYLPQVGHLFIIDNSEVTDEELIKELNKLKNSTYVTLGDNKGIAFALNTAAALALAAGYKYLLTMDDDTSMPISSISALMAKMHEGSFGIVAGQSDPRKYDTVDTAVDYTITSGSLLNLDAYKKCGPFLDDLFIDFVDIEYCFRLTNNSYRIIELNNIHVKHRLGLAKRTSWCFGIFYLDWFTHSPERVYYKVRNCLYVMSKYNSIPNKVKKIFFRDIFREFLNIVFLETNKWKRFILFLRAFRDGQNRRLGKIDDSSLRNQANYQ